MLIECLLIFKVKDKSSQKAENKQGQFTVSIQRMARFESV